ncbi:sigma factor [Mesorhizobium sp. B2-8-3]|uniref:RNA polymerase sigma factor n=1 Tax=Mesorhizobium sp. B2-8-3 TaxID=2589905 RepID=UPI001FEFAAD4|nr:sigma factor [Mesorhizobium sp. B2-8-3]
MLVGLRPKLHRYAARMAGSAIEGEDIVQEAVVKALAAHDGGARVERPEQWLFRIAHNAAQDHLRRRQRERSRMSEADMTAIADLSASAETRLATAMSLGRFMRLTPLIASRRPIFSSPLASGHDGSGPRLLLRNRSSAGKCP